MSSWESNCAGDSAVEGIRQSGFSEPVRLRREALRDCSFEPCQKPWVLLFRRKAQCREFTMVEAICYEMSWCFAAWGNCWRNWVRSLKLIGFTCLTHGSFHIKVTWSVETELQQPDTVARHATISNPKLHRLRPRKRKREDEEPTEEAQDVKLRTKG